MREIVPKPVPALPEDLRVAVELLELVARDFRAEMIFDLEKDLRADEKW